MLHLNYLSDLGNYATNDSFVKKATGRYYTGELAGRKLAERTATAFYHSHSKPQVIRIIDPFGGDARLLQWLIEAWSNLGYPKVRWEVSIWDFDTTGFDTARTRLKDVARSCGVKIRQSYRTVDTFAEALSHAGIFDIVLTNPPWEMLKPDHRELKLLDPKQRTEYVDRMRSYDQWLAAHYPLSQPRRKFAGWGTNLSRVGIETSLLLARQGGLIGAVLPASTLADDQTVKLRRHLLMNHRVLSVDYFPAEEQLYDGADVASIGLVLEVGGSAASSLTVTSRPTANDEYRDSEIPLCFDTLGKVDFVIPVSFGSELISIQNRIAKQFPTWGELESNAADGLWAGREMDETDSARWLVSLNESAPLFVKGKMIGRYRVLEVPSQSIIRPKWTPPTSTLYQRIVWRDVSRPNQKRRLIATLAKPGWVAGNSLGVAYFRDGANTALLALLGIVNSLTFEFQLRAYLATSHVSLSSLRKVCVPSREQLNKESKLACLVEAALSAGDEAAYLIDAYVAKNIYQLAEDEYANVLNGFPRLEANEKSRYLSFF